VVQFRLFLGNTDERERTAVFGGLARLSGDLRRVSNAPFGWGSGRRESLEAQQFEPVWMGLTRQQLLGQLADPLSAAAAPEHTMVQEELQQAQVGLAQVASQEEVPAQPRVQVLYHRTRTRTRARRVVQGGAHVGHEGHEPPAQLGVQFVPALPEGAYFSDRGRLFQADRGR